MSEIKPREHHDITMRTTAEEESQEHAVLSPELTQLFQLLSLREKLESWLAMNPYNDFVEIIRSSESDDVPQTRTQRQTDEDKLRKEIESQVVQANTLLNKTIGKLSKSSPMRELWQQHIPDNTPRTVDDARERGREIMEALYHQYTRRVEKLPKPHHNGDKIDETRYAEVKRLVAWDMVGIAPPAREDFDTDSAYKKAHTQYEKQASVWNTFIQQLRVLPGPHQDALAAYLVDTNAHTAEQLILSYKTYAYKDRKISLEFHATQHDYDQFTQLLSSISSVCKNMEIKGGAKMEGLEVQEAQEIMGADKFFGPEQVTQVWGTELAEIPEIPYTQAELEDAKEKGFTLILFVDTDGEGNPLTPQRMQQTKEQEWRQQNKGKLLYDTEGYQGESFFTDMTSQIEWKLVGTTLLENSRSKDYADQTRIIRDHLKSLIDQGRISEEHREAYENAIAACDDATLDRLKQQARNDSAWQQTATELKNLKINQQYRLSFQEVVYLLVATHDTQNTRLLAGVQYAWTNTQSSSGHIVDAGYFDADGMVVLSSHPKHTHEDLGVLLSR